MGAMKDLMIDKLNNEPRYFSRITADHWCAKNKLEEAVKDLAREMDRLLITEQQLQNFLKSFDEKIKDLQLQHRRCKPLRFSWHKGYEKDWTEWWIYCDGVFQMSLIEVKALE